MSKYVAGLICNEAAREIQGKIGGSYQTALLFPLLNEEYEYTQNFHDWPGLLRADSAAVAEDDTEFVLPAKYKKLVQTYQPSDQQSPGLSIYDSLDTAEAALVSILRGGTSMYLPVPGNAFYSAFKGEQCVKAQPSSAATCNVVSDSASDTSKKVLLQGEDTNGNYISEVVTANGTTPVASTLSFLRFTNVSKETTTTGNISVTNTAGTVTYCTIAPWARRAYYATYQMGAAATAAATIYFVAKLRFRPFLDNIEPPFMDGIAASLKFGTCARAMLEKRENAYAQDYFSMRDAELQRAISEITAPPDNLIVRC